MSHTVQADNSTSSAYNATAGERLTTAREPPARTAPEARQAWSGRASGAGRPQLPARQRSSDIGNQAIRTPEPSLPESIPPPHKSSSLEESHGPSLRRSPGDGRTNQQRADLRLARCRPIGRPTAGWERPFDRNGDIPIAAHEAPALRSGRQRRRGDPPCIGRLATLSGHCIRRSSTSTLLPP